MMIVAMLAEAPPATSSDWLNNLQFFCTLLLGVAGVYALFSNRTQKREVSFSEEFARKEDVRRLEDDVDGMRVKLDDLQSTIGGLEVKLNVAGERRAHEIHERIDAVLTAVSEVRGQIKQMNKEGGS